MMLALLRAFWHTWAERRSFRRADRSGVCPRCSSTKLYQGFGLAGGGYGPYVDCGRCGWFAKLRLP
jgi:uncharacterized protein (DUF983 family)